VKSGKLFEELMFEMARSGIQCGWRKIVPKLSGPPLKKRDAGQNSANLTLRGCAMGFYKYVAYRMISMEVWKHASV
jgi:hypothetical protein